MEIPNIFEFDDLKDKADNLFIENKFNEASKIYENLIKIDQTNFLLYGKLAISLINSNKIDKALNMLKKAIDINPLYDEGYFFYAIAFSKKGDYILSIKNFKKAIKINSKYNEAIIALADTYLGNGDFEKAIITYKKVLAFDQKNINSLIGLGVSFSRMRKFSEAIFNFKEVIKFDPSLDYVFANIGNLYSLQKRWDLAIDYYKKCLSINSKNLQAINSLAEVYSCCGDRLLAIEYYQLSLSINSKQADICNNLGNELLLNQDYKKAFIIYQKAININPNLPDAFYNLGTLVEMNKDYQKAIEYYIKAIEIKPEYTYANFGLIRCKNFLCDWSSNKELSRFINIVAKSKNSLNPIDFMTLEDNPSNHFIRAKNYYKENYITSNEKIVRKKKNKIRIGYFSSNFHTHPVMILMARVFELHNKNDFEIYFYHLSKSIEDKYTKRIYKCSNNIVDLTSISDAEAVSKIRNDNLDIAIDLNGYTRSNRMAIFSRRVAPIQITYLDNPGTTGSDCMDYILADKIIIPEINKKYFSEKVIYLPNSLQCVDDTLTPDPIKLNRKDLGLPEKGFIFCSFGNPYKISAKEYNIWMNLLNNVDDSVLWLITSSEIVKSNLKRESEIRGVDPKRIKFSNKVSLEKHMSRQNCADLFLDTFNYTSGLMTYISLVCGLPLLTLAGKSFSARISTSVLSAISMTELIAHNEAEYEQIAYQLATNKNIYKGIKSKLIKQKQESAYFNSASFVSSLEIVYKGLFNK